MCIVLHVHLLEQLLAACIIPHVVSIISGSGKQRNDHAQVWTLNITASTRELNTAPLMRVIHGDGAGHWEHSR
jgi:hypothetical protein